MSDTISIMQLLELFPDNATSEKWFRDVRWPDGLRCAHCNGERVAERGSHPTSTIPLSRL